METQIELKKIIDVTAAPVILHRKKGLYVNNNVVPESKNEGFFF